jgi:hypothetical protein
LCFFNCGIIFIRRLYFSLTLKKFILFIFVKKKLTYNFCRPPPLIVVLLRCGQQTQCERLPTPGALYRRRRHQLQLQQVLVVRPIINYLILNDN